MQNCSSCSRAVRDGELSCPFCGVSMLSPGARLVRVLTAGTTLVVLAACYGPPPGKDTQTDSNPVVDADQDGSTSDVDCDDNNNAVYPGATELCSDGVDNDCDGAADTADSDCTT